MRVSIERLRVWLLVGAGLLVVVIAGFLEYAHLRAHRFLKDLPSRLGADITRESNGFTWSQTSRGRTVYTIHAARLVQRKDGRTTLHDVGIVLYGQKGDRADRIYGSEFEYDQKGGVIRAVGEVHLDLQAPAPTDARGRAAYASGHDAVGSGHGAGDAHGDAHGDVDERMVHVKTSGLVFVQSLGVASTDQEIEFQYHGMNGHAKGADYNSDTGVTVLQTDVRVSGLRDNEPALLTAEHAEMDRTKGQLLLRHARYFAGVNGGPSRGASEGRVVAAEELTAHLRADGSLDRLLAHGGVSLEQDGGVLRGRDADVLLSDENRPELAHLSGEISYRSATALREVDGRAERGTLHFDGKGRAETAVAEGSGEVHVRERGGAALPWSERTISGERITGRFANASGRQWVREGTVTGAGRVLLVDRGRQKSTGAGETSSELRADVFTAQMRWDGRAAQLDHLRGKGHTLIDRRDDTGAEDTSKGEVLDVSFRPEAGAAKKGEAGTAGGTIARAVQSGGVALTHLPGRRTGSSGPPLLTRARGSEAVFEGDGETLTVRGQAEIAQAEDLLRADSVTLHRGSGDATAVGRVEVSYRRDAGAEPVHVLAARAEFQHDAGEGRFYGSGAVGARLWQGGSQVEAPVIELQQGAKTLTASTGGAGSEVVRTVLAGATRPGAGKSGAGKTGAGKTGAEKTGAETSGVMRISSRGLRYSDADRRALFSGGVVLQDSVGTVRASEMVAVLAAPGSAGATPAATGTALMSGHVDHVIATGAVDVSEPGRHATGDRLIYTSSDGKFVMTGSAGAPPKVQDDVQGTITGAALEFHAGDNSVMVVGDGKGGQGRRVRTETLVERR